jgi:hypothetical protein
MTRLNVAHLRQQGQDMIIVPLESSFGSKSNSDQQAAIAELQMRSGRRISWQGGSGMGQRRRAHGIHSA